MRSLSTARGGWLRRKNRGTSVARPTSQYKADINTRYVLRHFVVISLLAFFIVNTATADTGKNMPDISLPGIRNGQQAIDALGDNLPAVAAAHRMESQELRRVLAEDRAS